MRDSLLVAWVALLMATRIDFLGGEGLLVLTPFLVLAPLIVAVELIRSWTSLESFELPPGTAGFFLSLTALFTVLMGSTLLSYELDVSARRLALLVVQGYIVLVIGLVLLNRPAPGDLLLRGAYLGLGLVALLDVLQLYVFVADPPWASAAAVLVDLEPGTYFGVVPRLTGLSHDPNHGGLFTVFLTWLVATLGRPSRTRSVFLVIGTVAVLATLSRSALLAGLVIWIATRLTGRSVRFTPTAVGVAALLVLSVAGTYLAAPHLVEPVEDLGTLLSNRFTLDEGSSSEHALLLVRGWEVATDNLKHLFIGIGYGNAFVETQDIFPGNDYGNFHSLFLTLLVEGGVFALGLGLWLFVQAFRTGEGVRPLLAGLVAFNLFQQTHAEPLLWLCLMMAWVGGWTTDWTARSFAGLQTAPTPFPSPFDPAPGTQR